MNVVDSSAWLEYLADGPNASLFAPVIEARHSSRHAESEQKAKQREHGSFNRSNSLVSGIGVPARLAKAAS